MKLLVCIRGGVLTWKWIEWREIVWETDSYIHTSKNLINTGVKVTKTTANYTSSGWLVLVKPRDQQYLQAKGSTLWGRRLMQKSVGMIDGLGDWYLSRQRSYYSHSGCLHVLDSLEWEASLAAREATALHQVRQRRWSDPPSLFTIQQYLSIKYLSIKNTTAAKLYTLNWQ